MPRGDEHQQEQNPEACEVAEPHLAAGRPRARGWGENGGEHRDASDLRQLVGMGLHRVPACGWNIDLVH